MTGTLILVCSESVILSFLVSLNRLASRLKSKKETTISFDKDDDDTLDFVTATANLRASCYAIENKTRWEVKGMIKAAAVHSNSHLFSVEMAGNIIPAIATTNAIIAGLIVLQALHVLRLRFLSGPMADDCPLASPSKQAASSKSKTAAPPEIRNATLQFGKPSVPLGTYSVSTPNPFCGVCRDSYVPLQCDPTKATLGEILSAVMDAESGGDEDELREVNVYEGQRMLCDPDWDDNLSRTLESLGCGRGKFLTIMDEDGTFENVVLCLIPL